MLINILIAVAMVMIVAGIVVILVKRKKEKTPEPMRQQQDEVVPRRRVQRNGLEVLTNLLKAMAGSNHFCFDGLYIPTSKGTPRSIDALVVGVNGIFVFRYMPIEGWILGNENSRWWTHFISTDDRRYINNPIWEMDELIRDLQTFLPKTRLSDYRPYVVCSNKCEFRSLEITGDTRVINLRQMTALFEDDLNTAPIVYDQSMVHSMCRVFEVLDDPASLKERLVLLKDQMNEDKLEAIRAESEAEMAKKIDEAMGFKVPAEEIQRKREKNHIRKYRPEERFTRSELVLRDALILWRKQQADTRCIAIVEVFDNRVLDAIVLLKPKTIDALRRIPWMSEEKIAEYGPIIVTMVKHAPVE